MADESFDGQGEEELDFSAYWRVLLRRRWYLMLPFFVGWVVVFGASWFMPSVYRSGTLILVEQPTVSQQYVVSNVATDLQSRLDSLTQQVLSRTRLLRIIEKLNLFPKHKGLGPDEMVEQMRRSIQIELVRSPDHDQLTAFNIYFSADNPYVAQQVTTELTNILISENLEVRQQQSEDTTSFLQSQLDESRKNLADQEAKVREFKDRHLGELPGQLQSNLQILSGMQTQLQAEQDAFGRAKQQNAYLQSLISQYRSVSHSPKTAGAAGSTTSSVDQELDRLKSQLADLQSRYTDQHPDVRKVKDQIVKTERMKQQLQAEQARTAAATPSDNGTDGDAGGREGTPMMEVQSQLKANEIEMTNRQRSISDLQFRIGDYQSRLNRTPVREQELADLTRDYDQSRTYYESLLAKRNQSELATNLERRQQSEHFRIVDPPSLPSKPFSPNRFKLSLMGIAVGLGLGVVAAGAAEILDDRIYAEKEFKKLLPVQLIIEVPPLVSPAQVALQQRQTRWEWVATAAMAAIVMVGVAVSYLRS
jgi:succinoglycan biosynthesis transport protein ExoP